MKLAILFFISLAVSIAKCQDEKPFVYKPEPNKTVCYDYVGCFDNFPPFTNTGFYLPEDPVKINTEFLLFTPYNKHDEQYLTYKDIDTIKNSNFDKILPTKVIVHGFSNNKNTPWLHELKNALLSNNLLQNVIIVGWGNGATFPLYNNASSNTRVVGKELALLLKAIQDVNYSSNRKEMNIHCIGHSLGSHVCAMAGSSGDIKIHRISGLDPAGPMFENENPTVRLDKTDADFVDAYHTNAGVLLTGSFGIIMPVGHVDYFINGGNFQPGCPSISNIIGGIFGNSGGIDPTKEVGCSHNRVISYYTESISSSCSLTSLKCENKAAFENSKCNICESNECGPIGFLADSDKAQGDIYAVTRSQAPFCGNIFSIQVNISSNSPRSAGELSINLNANNKNENALFTNIDFPISQGAKISKYFSSVYDDLNANSLELSFNKKPKILFFDPNSNTVNINKIKITALNKNKIYSICENIKIENGKSTSFSVNDGDCE